MRFPAEVLLVLAFGFAVVIFWRLHHARVPDPTVPATEKRGGSATLGNLTLRLGQNAVAPERQWLLIRPGGV